jgi:hypothetical protein
LETWRSINAKMRRMSEAEVLAALEHERATARRASILERLHARYCTLRAARERIEILKEATKA